MFTMKRHLFLLATLVPGLLLAQPSENWNAVNLAVTDGQVIPAYAALAEAAAALPVSARAFCRAPDAAGLAAFRTAFHGAMDAWQGIQHIQFGPITYFNWNFRLQYWPDTNGTGVRQLDTLVETGNSEVLEPDNFARESVSVQGFPALERLLFDDESLVAFRDDPYRCQVAAAIARNISEIATGVHTRWVEEFRTTVATADERGFFESAEDATIDFLKAQVEPVRRIQQQKLEEVIGETEAQARIRRAESWRSDRSVRNIRLNVAALEQLFNGSEGQEVTLSAVLLPEDVVTVNEKFAGLQAVLAGLPDSVEDAMALDGGHSRLLAAASGLDALFEALEAALKNTDLYLGFNSLDGD